MLGYAAIGDVSVLARTYLARQTYRLDMGGEGEGERQPADRQIVVTNLKVLHQLLRTRYYSKDTNTYQCYICGALHKHSCRAS